MQMSQKVFKFEPQSLNQNNKLFFFVGKIYKMYCYNIRYIHKIKK